MKYFVEISRGGCFIEINCRECFGEVSRRECFVGIPCGESIQEGVGR